MTAPLVGPPQIRSADPPGRGYTCLGNRLLEEWAQAEPHGVTEASARVAEGCGVSRQYVTGWRAGKPVPPKHRQAIHRVTGISIEVWETWELLGREEPEETPPSGEREADGPAAPLGTTAAELRATIQRIDAVLRKRSITPAQEGQLLGKRTTALGALARLEDRQAIEDHPDAEPFLEDVVQALLDVLGPDAPEGIGARVAERLVELQAARAATPRKAAAA
jgi:transcriptional regulator with XRE-family HTH domain